MSTILLEMDELRRLLSEAYDAGWYGSRELKPESIEGIARTAVVAGPPPPPPPTASQAAPSSMGQGMGMGTFTMRRETIRPIGNGPNLPEGNSPLLPDPTLPGPTLPQEPQDLRQTAEPQPIQITPTAATITWTTASGAVLLNDSVLTVNVEPPVELSPDAWQNVGDG